MKLLLLGATGRTGNIVLDYALSQGHQVVALVRNLEKISAQSDRLTVIKGTPGNAEDVAKAIVGCNAVVVALNNNRTSDMPWAKPVSPSHLMETAVRTSVAAMTANGIRRIVILSAAGVGDSFSQAPGIMRLLIRNSNLGVTYADHDGVDAYIRTTHTDWTLVRPALLTNANKIKTLIVSYANDPKPAMMISRRHVAEFMINSLGDTTFFEKAPVISEK